LNARQAIAEPASRRARLSRGVVVDRALEIGSSEGLEAVTLRRLAAELGVTPMALYRHFHDKQDLINAMAEAVIGDMDVTVGFEPSMSWTDRVRRAMLNYKQQTDARPLALPLSIAYSGDGPPSFWKMLDDLLGILLDAGFARRQAVILIRAISNLLAGYLLLLRQDVVPGSARPDDRQVELIRKRFELVMLALPTATFPNLVASADDVAEVWLSDPDRWWQDTVDLITFGLERLLERSTASAR
jgi:TetR/AcrR family transcriptional regulator, tetracycline repressor protein